MTDGGKSDIMGHLLRMSMNMSMSVSAIMEADTAIFL